MSTTGLRANGTMWFKFAKNKGAQLKINLYSPIVLQLNADQNGKRTMMIRCILTELLECKVHGNAYVSLCQHIFGTLSGSNSVGKHQITMVL